MGHVYVKAIVAGEKARREISDLLVETGATFTILPPEIIQDIGTTPRPRKVRLELGDGRKMEADEYVLDVTVENREASTFALTFRDAKPVLGVLTLETLGLKVNPVSGKLEAARPPGVAYYYRIERIVAFLERLSTLSKRRAVLRISRQPQGRQPIAAHLSPLIPAQRSMAESRTFSVIIIQLSSDISRPQITLYPIWDTLSNGNC